MGHVEWDFGVGERDVIGPGARECPARLFPVELTLESVKSI